jgi:hypothetical protein
MPGTNIFRSIFLWLMGFVALSWVWTVVLMIAWPTEQTSRWEPDFRLAATCANGEACSAPYGGLADAKAKGLYKSLLPPEPVGETMEADAWLRWKTATGKPWQYEATRSSWYFLTAVRYRFEGETPILVEVSRYDARLFLYALPLALLSLVALHFAGRRGK